MEQGEATMQAWVDTWRSGRKQHEGLGVGGHNNSSNKTTGTTRATKARQKPKDRLNPNSWAVIHEGCTWRQMVMGTCALPCQTWCEKT